MSVGPSVTFDAKGKVILPALPQQRDVAALCSWLTCVFSLARAQPITGGTRQGLAGPDGHVALTRAGDAPSIRFEPATRINTPSRLIETLSWQLLPTDGALHALTSAHCRDIAYVVRMLCGAGATITDAQETAALLGTFFQSADAVEGHTTYATSAQRYEAAAALRSYPNLGHGRLVGARNYLIDKNTGEYVICVSDLVDAARRHVGGSLAHGWLDARMQNLGWTRVRLDAHAVPGRAGRTSPHLRVNVYRGLLPAEPGVTT